MSKEKQTEEKTDKIVTRYDRRMEKRRIEEEKERRSWKRFKIISLLIVVVIAAAIVISLGTSAYRKYAAINNTYVRIGDHDVTRVEYDYYYYNSMTSYLNMYGSYVSMLGLDVSLPMDQQSYMGSEDLTWKDFFDQLAVTQLQQVKALVDEAEAEGFTYDDSEDMAQFETDFAAEAESASQSVGQFYATAYGEYATESRVRPYIRENMLATAYYDHLIEQNRPSDEEVQAYYEENKNGYDTVTYRSFYFEAETEEETTEEGTEAVTEETTADSTETAAEETTIDSTETAVEETTAESTEAATEETTAESTEAAAEETTIDSTETAVEETAAESTEAAAEETTAESTEAAAEDETTEDTTDAELEAAMAELSVKAEEMVERRRAGEDFEDLCVEYASEDRKENYGGEEDGSLMEEVSYSGTPMVASDWLFDESRKEGDISIFEDTNRYYVVEFISRQNDEETTNESISTLLAEQTVGEYIAELGLQYEVTDVAGELHYLTVETETETATEGETGTAETESETDTAEAETEAATETATAQAETETAETASVGTETAENETAETGSAAAETTESVSTEAEE